jgi:hypothetical protein
LGKFEIIASEDRKMSSQFVLISFCNNPESTTSPILCVKVPGAESDVLEYSPVFLGYSGLINHATGLTTTNETVFVSFHSDGKFYIAGLRKHDLLPTFYQELPEVKDVHSILAWNDHLYVVSTGTDEILVYYILGDKLSQAQVVWRASSEQKDTHHVNSIVENNGELFVSAFGPKTAELWASAPNGYIQNITQDSRVKEEIYHPHSLSARNGQLYYCESHRGTFCSLDNQISQLSGYSRGVSWLSDERVCITTSIGRKVSRSTGQVGNPADPGEPLGQCSLIVQDVESSKMLEMVDFSWFGPEIYDVLVLSDQQIDLLKLATIAQRAERDALQPLLNENSRMTQVITENEQAIEALKAEKKQITKTLHGIYQSRSWRWTEPLRKINERFRL